MKQKNNEKKSILTTEEIDEIIEIIEEDICEVAIDELIRKRNILLEFFKDMSDSINNWVGPDLKHASLHSVDELSYSDFLFAVTDLAEHYINVHHKDINTNIILGIDDSLLIGLNGDPTINRKTNRSDFNELKITEGISAFLRENDMIEHSTVIKEDKDSEIKHLPVDDLGFVLLYELTPTACTGPGLIYVFIPSTLIEYKFNTIKENIENNNSKKVTLTAKLGEVKIDSDDLERTNEYDIISLNKKANAPIEIYLKDKKLFEGIAVEKEDNTLGVVVTKKF